MHNKQRGNQNKYILLHNINNEGINITEIEMIFMYIKVWHLHDEGLMNINSIIGFCNFIRLIWSTKYHILFINIHQDIYQEAYYSFLLYHGFRVRWTEFGIVKLVRLGAPATWGGREFQCSLFYIHDGKLQVRYLRMGIVLICQN